MKRDPFVEHAAKLDSTRYGADSKMPSWTELQKTVGSLVVLLPLYFLAIVGWFLFAIALNVNLGDWAIVAVLVLISLTCIVVALHNDQQRKRSRPLGGPKPEEIETKRKQRDAELDRLAGI